ncbi:hypothetical protein [Azospirillum sp. ST 5-10]|uniref:hypothetical protein n=1 Tax=unclassified Azospirillum TaxID=2630922 RepID=UPI003F4A6464
MTRKRRRAPALTAGEIAATFTRGMVAGGLIAAIQDRATAGAAPPGRTVLRHALQGGAALAAGAAAAEALRGRDVAGAVLAVAAGAAGVVVVEHLLNPAPSPTPVTHEENDRG